MFGVPASMAAFVICGSAWQKALKRAAQASSSSRWLAML
jgi:hypothetical protein